MKVAFYSPIKPPDHPVPSGDRLMARLLIRALEVGGAEVDVVSRLRSFRGEPAPDLAALRAAAESEADRISDRWADVGTPDLFITYHPYYKAPDLLGSALARRASIPYVTVEASYSRRRNASGWRERQDFVAASIQQASVNISMTERDRDGLIANFPAARTALLPPFLDVAPFLEFQPEPEPGRLLTVAMMRPGDKFDSFRMLSEALAGISDAGWTLSIIGHGPLRGDVGALFAMFPPDRVIWHGELGQHEIARLLARGSIYVWPGCGEAYGLAYLEAQAAGLPVVAQEIAGVPAVVMQGRTGLLTPAGDAGAFGMAIRRLLDDRAERFRLAVHAREFVRNERSMPSASGRLMSIIREFTGVSS